MSNALRMRAYRQRQRDLVASSSPEALERQEHINELARERMRKHRAAVKSQTAKSEIEQSGT